MFKRMLCLLFVFMMLAILPAAAEESDAEILTLQDLWQWADDYQTLALASQPLNDPTAAGSYTEDGYAFVYEFATLYMDRPEMTADSDLRALVVYTDEQEGPRGVGVDDPAQLVLSAYYTENPDLVGNRNEAVLYAIDMMPECAYVGTIHRDGQRIQVIDYAVYELAATGGDGYTNAGISYTLQDNNVTAIRLYGLHDRISAEDVSAILAQAQELAREASYSQVPTSYVGSELEPFDSEDVIFSGLDFAALTPEEAISVLGNPSDDVWLEDGDGYMRKLEFAACEMTFFYDAARENGRVMNMTIHADTLEGPRSVRVGDTVASVINRFRNGEGSFDGSVEALYGSEESGSFGVADYRADGSILLRYGTVTENGASVVMYLFFDHMYLQEILLMAN